MQNQNTRKRNRIWITINFLALFAVLTFFYTGKFYQWTVLYTIFEITSLVILLSTCGILRTWTSGLRRTARLSTLPHRSGRRTSPGRPQRLLSQEKLSAMYPTLGPMSTARLTIGSRASNFPMPRRLCPQTVRLPPKATAT